jgi:hypothetical protein
MSKLLDLVKDKTVHFMFYRSGNLWYIIDDDGFEFPVPITDCGDAVFLAEDKAILFMRYIRKQLQVVEKAREEMEHGISVS